MRSGMTIQLGSCRQFLDWLILRFLMRCWSRSLIFTWFESTVTLRTREIPWIGMYSLMSLKVTRRCEKFRTLFALVRPLPANIEGILFMEIYVAVLTIPTRCALSCVRLNFPAAKTLNYNRYIWMDALWKLNIWSKYSWWCCPSNHSIHIPTMRPNMWFHVAIRKCLSTY